MTLRNWNLENSCSICPLNEAVEQRPWKLEQVEKFGHLAVEKSVPEEQEEVEQLEPLGGFANRFFHDAPALSFHTEEDITAHEERCASLCQSWCDKLDNPIY